MEIKNSNYDKYGYKLDRIESISSRCVSATYIHKDHEEYLKLNGPSKSITFYFHMKFSLINKTRLKKKLEDKTIIEVLAENPWELNNLIYPEVCGIRNYLGHLTHPIYFSEDAIHDLFALLPCETEQEKETYVTLYDRVMKSYEKGKKIIEEFESRRKNINDTFEQIQKI